MGPTQQIAEGVGVRTFAVEAPGVLRVKEHEPPAPVLELRGYLLALRRVVPERLVVVPRPVLVCDEHLHAIVLHEVVDVDKPAVLRKGAVIGQVAVVVGVELSVILQSALAALVRVLDVAYYLVVILVPAEIRREVVLVVVLVHPGVPVVLAVEEHRRRSAVLRHRIAVILRQLLGKLVPDACELAVVGAVAEHYAVELRHRNSVGGLRALEERIFELAVVRVVALAGDEPQRLLVGNPGIASGEPYPRRLVYHLGAVAFEHLDVDGALRLPAGHVVVARCVVGYLLAGVLLYVVVVDLSRHRYAVFVVVEVIRVGAQHEHQRIAVEPLRDVLPDNVAHRADVALRPVGQHRQRLHRGCPDLRRGVYLDGLRVKLGLPGHRVGAVGGEIHRAAVR